MIREIIDEYGEMPSCNKSYLRLHKSLNDIEDVIMSQNWHNSWQRSRRDFVTVHKPHVSQENTGAKPVALTQQEFQDPEWSPCFY